MKIETRKLREIMPYLTFAVQKRKVKGKGDIPILRDVMIQAKDGIATLTTTDLNLTYSGRIEVEGDGDFFISAKMLAEILRSAEAVIELIPTEKQFTLKTGSAEWVLDNNNVDQYVTLPETPNVFQPISLTSLKKAIAYTRFAIAAPASSRFTLSGAKMIFGVGLKVITTDGHRLALYNDPTVVGIEMDALVPSRMLDFISKLKADETSIACTDNHIWIQTENAVISCRKLSGNFPKYEMVLPKDNDKHCAVDAIALKRACEQIMIGLSRYQHPAIYWHIDNGNSRVTNKDERFKSQLVTSGDKGFLAFNPRYLFDLCKVLPGVLDISFKSDPTTVAEIREKDSDVDFRCVLMPLRV